MRCPSCGNEFRDGVRFCPACGTPVEAAVKDATMPRASAPPPVASGPAAPPPVVPRTLLPPPVVPRGKASARPFPAGTAVAAAGVLVMLGVAAMGYLYFSGIFPRSSNGESAEPVAAGSSTASDSGAGVSPETGAAGGPGKRNSLLAVSGKATRVSGEMMGEMAKGRENTAIGKGLMVGARINTEVGGAVEDVGEGRASGREPAPDRLADRVLEDGEGDAPADGQAQEPPSWNDTARPVPACSAKICIEVWEPALSVSSAAPGDEIRCRARYTFVQKDSPEPVEVEESVQVEGVRKAEASRRVKVRSGANELDLSFVVPKKAAPGDYTVTLSVRRMRTTGKAESALTIRE